MTVSLTSKKPVVGVLGAGQLARMFALKAYQHGVSVRFYASSEDEPACHVGPHDLGGFDDLKALISFAKQCDVITLENEFIDASLLKRVEDESGVVIYPSPESYGKIRSKLGQKQLMETLGISLPTYQCVSSWQDCLDFLESHHVSRAMLKTDLMGYDGYGNLIITKESENGFNEFAEANSATLFLEGMLNIKREWAVMIGCLGDQVVSYPAVETVQKNQRCDYVLMNRDDCAKTREVLKAWSLKIGQELNTRGIFAFEFFEDQEGRFYYNESAPRPHNSHHYTQNAASVDQFEMLLFSLLGWDLPEPQVYHHAVMGNLLGKTQGGAFSLPSELPQGAHLHLYGKLESRPQRKMGHVNVVGDSTDDLLKKWNEIKESYQW